MEKILELLPGFNCDICGQKNCSEFARLLLDKKTATHQCTVLLQERFKKKKQHIDALLQQAHCLEARQIKGLIDGAKADFELFPLNNEPSCRETLVSFASVQIPEGSLIKYRPLGCPITHFARVIHISYGLIDVWVEGPCILLKKNETPIELGICMVLSFQGTIKGNLPNIGQTVKFLPNHCMMGKIHSGIIVKIENEQTQIDCIDLKIWEHTT